MATGALTEEIATNLEEVAEITRQVDPRIVGVFLGGLSVGTAIGFFFGYRFNKEKIRAEAFKVSEEEIEKMRETYMQKTTAAQPKPSAEKVVEERGYDVAYTERRPLKPPVPIHEAPIIINIPEELVGRDSKSVWNYAEELAGRDPTKPYVIHQEEFKNSETGYEQTTLTYWAVDEVLTDDENKILHHDDGLVGADNLKWGHGADDGDVVFVRNEFLEQEFEICRINKSYGQEVMGIGPAPEDEIEHSSYPQQRRSKRQK